MLSLAVSKIDLRHLSDNTDSTRIHQKRMFFCRGRRQMNFKSSVIIFVCGIRGFRIFKTNPYQNGIRPYNSQIINNPYNIMRQVWPTTTEGIYLRTHSDGRLFSESLTMPVSEPRQRYARFSSGTCCLLTTQQLRPTPRRNSSHWWTASHRPARTSDWPSTGVKKTNVLGQGPHRSGH